MADKNYLDSDGVLYLWQKIKAKITDAIKNKVDKEDGKGLSTNDYTTAEKTKLTGIADGANKYSHPTNSGNKHIPAGGSSGQILRWSADGTAAWGSDNNTTYSEMTGATASADGKSGLVPTPAKGKQGQFLRGDGTWQTPANTTYSDMKGATTTAAGTHGLVPAPAAGKQGQYLRGDGTWATPANTTYADATQSTHGLMSTTDKQKLDAYPAYSSIQSTYATKSEITNMYKYCGSVASADKLPTAKQRVGDVYNIETASTYGGAGMNVAWNGSVWDPLGEIFSISTITNTWMDTNLT